MPSGSRLECRWLACELRTIRSVYAGYLESHPFTTVVSGLPRSGTSLMMQMLAAGGIPLLTDGVRTPDLDNPRGYFEFEPVKQTRQDPSWIPTAVGKAVKMVTVLLRDLPPEFDYRVILICRDLDETVASQKAMLHRLCSDMAPKKPRMNKA